MKINPIFRLFLVTAVFYSCTNPEKDQELKDREVELNKREDLLNQKEAEYQSLIKMRDSIFAKNDSIPVKIWPENIAGEWTAKSICEESNCQEYAIGDNRIENWDFKSDSLKLYAVTTHNKNSKLFDASYDDQKITLDYSTDSTAKRRMKINLVLNDISKSKIKGTATVTLDNQCNAKFNVELNRSLK